MYVYFRMLFWNSFARIFIDYPIVDSRLDNCFEESVSFGTQWLIGLSILFVVFVISNNIIWMYCQRRTKIKRRMEKHDPATEALTPHGFNQATTVT